MLFIEGISAVVAAAIIFVGSIFLLLAMVMGARLAYFVSASITLAVLVILSIVWSLNPLGPVGTLPSWSGLGVGPDPSQLSFGPAAQYPSSPWTPPDATDTTQATQVSELEGESTNVLDEAITSGKVHTFQAATDAIVNSDKTRLLDQGGKLYGAVTLEPGPGKKGEPTVAVLSYDPGNPLGPPRRIAGGMFLLLVLHIFGLSRSEKRARERAGAVAEPGSSS